MTDIGLVIDDYELRKIFEKVVEEKVVEIVEPKISDAIIEMIDTEKVVKILEERLRHTLEKSRWGEREINATPIMAAIDSKLSEIAQNITDKELKDIILSRLITKIA